MLSRIPLTLHATRPTPPGDSRLAQPMSAWSVKTRRAPSRHCRGARVYGHTTTTMHDNEYTPPPSPSSPAAAKHANSSPPPQKKHSLWRRRQEVERSSRRDHGEMRPRLPCLPQQQQQRHQQQQRVMEGLLEAKEAPRRRRERGRGREGRCGRAVARRGGTVGCIRTTTGCWTARQTMEVRSGGRMGAEGDLPRLLFVVYTPRH